jgi:prolyl-tRNA synthetase
LVVVSPLALTEKNFSRVSTVVDASIDSDTIYALHASSSSSTIFLKGKDVLAYLRNLETSETKLQVVDFAEIAASPATGATAPAPPVPAKEKEDAKIEGAVQIAIGVKKEVDFASWYTNVRFFIDEVFLC